MSIRAEPPSSVSGPRASEGGREEGAGPGPGLHARGLVKSYRGRRVVDHVDFSLLPGEVAGLLGPNGAGKTTCFYMVVGLVQPEEGKVFLEGEDITNLPMFKRAQKGLSYLPQEPSIFRGLTVEENLMAVAEALPLSRKEREERVKTLLEELGVERVKNNKAITLSGGERRRVEIARSLVASPKFLLMDEPFAGVDPIAVADLQKIIAALSRKGIGVLITDHNVRETLRICKHATIIHEGRVMLSGSPEEIVQSPLARKHYLGEDFEMDLSRTRRPGEREKEPGL